MHDTVSKLHREVARRKIRCIAVPVREIAREHQHMPGGKHLEHVPEVLRTVRLFDRLGCEALTSVDAVAVGPAGEVIFSGGYR